MKVRIDNNEYFAEFGKVYLRKMQCTYSANTHLCNVWWGEGGGGGTEINT